MKLIRLRVEKLFDIFDYDILFESKQNLLMITGPNGFGKTMILNIIFNLFSKRLWIFRTLAFRKIDFHLTDDILIAITKRRNPTAPSHEVVFTVFKSRKEQETFTLSEEFDRSLMEQMRRFTLISPVSSTQWLDHRNNRIWTSDELVTEYGELLSGDVGREMLQGQYPQLWTVLDSLKVHLIKEQRLFKKVPNSDRNVREEKDQSVMIETIQSYAKDLSQLIERTFKNSFQTSQSLDSSYPNRLISEKGKLTRDEYNSRFNALQAKQDKLKNYGLYERTQEFLAYSAKDAKALLVYLNDVEKKLGVFDDLLTKLELFTGILNERRFTFKSIQIDREKGFLFKTTNGKQLELKQLSSGEQHEVVLLFELIFNAHQNTLVLIDEPEISLHVSWQKEFLNDLLRIISMQKIQVVVATHSPSIINDRWDLVFNLNKI